MIQKNKPTRAHRNSSLSRRRGAMIFLICIMMVAFIVTAAFSVDIAYMHLVRAELRSASDAAAKAAAQQLSDEVRASAASSGSLNSANVVQRAKTIASKNLVAGRGLLLDDSDIIIGRSSRSGGGKYTFQPGGTPENSVRVIGRRTSGSLSGNVGLFFGKLFGKPSFEPEETAIGTFIQRNIVLVIDRSGSMKFNEAGDRIYDGQTPDFGPESKITKVKESLDDFLSFLNASANTEKVGLVSFSSDATLDLSLTTDVNALSGSYAGLVPDGSTGIALAIDAAVALMNSDSQSQFVEKTIVVLTDGQENVGRDGVYYGDGSEDQVPEDQGAVRAAQDAAAQGFTIFSITYCVDSPKGRNTMLGVANAANGKYYDATGQADLSAAFKDITLALNAMLTN